MPEIYVGLGSNVRRRSALRFGLAELARRFGPLRVSSLYESPDAEHGGPAYLNLVASLHSECPPAELKDRLREIEDLAGRQRDRRTLVALDLDLLLWGTRVEPGPPALPHPELRDADHWLAPLAELAPALTHPASGESLAELWQERGHSTVRQVGRLEGISEAAH